MKFGVSVYNHESISVSIQTIVSLKFDTVVLELVHMSMVFFIHHQAMSPQSTR